MPSVGTTPHLTNNGTLHSPCDTGSEVYLIPLFALWVTTLRLTLMVIIGASCYGGIRFYEVPSNYLPNVSTRSFAANRGIHFNFKLGTKMPQGDTEGLLIIKPVAAACDTMLSSDIAPGLNVCDVAFTVLPEQIDASTLRQEDS